MRSSQRLNSACRSCPTSHSLSWRSSSALAAFSAISRRGCRLWHRGADAAGAGAGGRAPRRWCRSSPFRRCSPIPRASLRSAACSTRAAPLIALVAALPTCALGAWLYTLLTGRGAALVIGSTLIATVPLRRLLKRHGRHLGEKALRLRRPAGESWLAARPGPASSCLSLLMATGLEGAAVIATDAIGVDRHGRRQTRRSSVLPVVRPQTCS